MGNELLSWLLPSTLAALVAIFFLFSLFAELNLRRKVRWEEQGGPTGCREDFEKNLPDCWSLVGMGEIHFPSSVYLILNLKFYHENVTGCAGGVHMSTESCIVLALREGQDFPIPKYFVKHCLSLTELQTELFFPRNKLAFLLLAMKAKKAR